MISLERLKSMTEDIDRLTNGSDLTEECCNQLIAHIDEVSDYIQNHQGEFSQDQIQAMLIQCSLSKFFVMTRISEILENAA